MADVRELGYFVAVFEERNLTAAARRCFISQPSISTAISSLECELGAELFVRHRKGAVPTAAAELLYPVARRLVDETRALGSLFQKPVRARRFTLGLMASLDIARVLPMLEPLTRDPEVHLQLVSSDEQCDARVVSRGLLARGETFVPLWEERYVVALPPTHPLTLKGALRIEDLQGARLVERCHCENAGRFARQVRGLNVVARAQSEEWALALVAAGVGIALVPEGSVNPQSRVVTRELEGVQPARQVGLAYGGPRRRSAVVEVEDLIHRLTSQQQRGRQGRSTLRTANQRSIR